MSARKINFFHDSAHTQMRVSQGIPEAMAVLPSATSSASDILAFNVDRIVHVSSASAVVEHVHVYCTSTDDTDVFVEVVASADLVSSGSVQRASSWPKREMVLRVRANQPSPQILLQGFALSSGAALSICARSEGVLFFGFVVQDY
jgi:hypothetical protein